MDTTFSTCSVEYKRNGTNLNVVDVVAVPCGTKKFVAKSQNQKVLDHLLSKVVVNAENLLLFPVGFERLLKLPGRLQVAAKWFLDLQAVSIPTATLASGKSYDQPCNASVRVAVLLQML
jgi:hypothetical protein